MIPVVLMIGRITPALAAFVVRSSILSVTAAAPAFVNTFAQDHQADLKQNQIQLQGLQFERRGLIVTFLVTEFGNWMFMIL